MEKNVVWKLDLKMSSNDILPTGEFQFSWNFKIPDSAIFGTSLP